jgi:hypothetical protein
MTQISCHTPEHTRIRLIAAAIGHQQCTKTESNIIPLPGTDRVIAIGTPAQVAQLMGRTAAARDVLGERRRQVEAEGMTSEGDDQYHAAELPRAAAAYILSGANDEAPYIWPWAESWWKPRDARANYVRAAALLLAEIERIDRAAGADLVDTEGGHHD